MYVVLEHTVAEEGGEEGKKLRGRAPAALSASSSRRSRVYLVLEHMCVAQKRTRVYYCTSVLVWVGGYV